MKRERIGLVLGLALLVGIAVVPIPGIPDEARRMLAVAAIMATWWVTEAAPLAVTLAASISDMTLDGLLRSRSMKSTTPSNS